MPSSKPPNVALVSVVWTASTMDPSTRSLQRITLYSSTTLPLSLTASHSRVTLLPKGVARKPMTADGRPYGVANTTFDAVPPPTALTARTCTA